MDAAIAPVGYVTFPNIPKTLSSNARSVGGWGVQLPIDPGYFTDWIGHHFEPLDDSTDSLFERISNGSSASVLLQLSQLLTAGRLRSAGIVIETGEIVHLNSADWRRPIISNGQRTAPVVAACAGAVLSINRPGRPPFSILPILSLYDLAIAFGAEAPPPAPDEDIDDVEAGAVDDGQVDVSVRARCWMDGYAHGHIDGTGAKPKRESSIKLCQEHVGCTYRVATAAWDVLPGSLKGHPRTRAISDDK